MKTLAKPGTALLITTAVSESQTGIDRYKYSVDYNKVLIVFWFVIVTVLNLQRSLVHRLYASVPVLWPASLASTAYPSVLALIECSKLATGLVYCSTSSEPIA